MNRATPPNEGLPSLPPQVQQAMQAPQVVQPAPSPISATLGQHPGFPDLIALQIYTIVGQATYFMDGDSAIGLGKALQKMGSAGAAGLHLPGGAQL